MIKRYLILILSALMTTWAYSITPEQIAIQLQQQKSLEGSFFQQRYLRGLEKPIESCGKYLIETIKETKEKQLIWQVEQPFKVNLKITSEGIFQEKNQKWQKTSSNNARQMQLFLDLLSGDWHVLEKAFELTANGDSKQWTLVLTPKTTTLKKIFHSITLKGNQYLTHIELEEAQGDKSTIEFSPVL
ncbi:outer membrane lipoprotein carrier protein LolA [Suttonella ornithocola]|uniref:Lipoprotein chaperone n=1 Tax=Suttonella ornithocola TaxID=279832 RepID=A0A380MUN2_9GAMM|nr:outer membrane lipoprotein carrier protein LolA [Suttonella ornithocola]SUO95421.1 lipoprotein chaperone [Suttonella ornithocola]